MNAEPLWIAGATGLVGAAFTARYVAEGGRAVVFTRRPLDTPWAAAVTEARVDLVGAGPLPGAPPPAPYAAVCALGTTRKKAGSDSAFRAVDLDAVVHFARLAREAGARRFVLVSSVGANARSSFLYPRTKGQAEEAIRPLGFAGLTILRPSVLDGDRGESRPGERAAIVLGRALRPILRGPLATLRPTAVTAVVRAIGEGLGRDGEHILEPSDFADE